ncbi:MAG TPA: type II secretion system F family protein [Acidimicrobiales bacterium]|nr:type II secretion system F family protein [Acidimicrobiales bacterium]
MRLALLSALVMAAGVTLVLSELRWFSRPALVDRLRPYGPGGMSSRSRSRLPSVESFGDVIGPLCRLSGERLARALGVSEDLATRLERIHSPLDVTAFRVRQLGWSGAGFALGCLLSLALRPPVVLALLFIFSGPALAFLILENQVAKASEAWKRRLFLELPVLSEQLAMLLSAGFSLGAALNRLAARGRGNAARDLARVCGRIRQGLSEIEALREWAALADVEALDRLLPVLALNREASDLGRLISEEARAIRRDVQRELVETAERRGQQVWVPVTVAALVPGVMFLAIPFIHALQLFSGS